MTYRTLLNKLQAMPADRLSDAATLFDGSDGQFYSIDELLVADPRDTDVLDEGHFFLTVLK
jgi:hypothetical protein